MHNLDNKPYLSPAEVPLAGYPFTKNWLDKNRCFGGPDAVPFVRVGRRIFYRRDALDDYLNRRVFTSTSQ